MFEYLWCGDFPYGFWVFGGSLIVWCLTRVGVFGFGGVLEFILVLFRC